MKVLVLKANHFPVCGASRLVETVLAHVDRSRITPIVGSVARRGREHSIHFTSPRTADLPHVEIPWSGGLRSRAAILALRAAIAEHGVDLVHTHDMRCDLLVALAGGSKGLGVPWVAQVHGWIGSEARGKDRVFEWVDRCSVRCADEVWVGSRNAEADVRRTLGPRGRLRFLQNAADPRLVAPARERAAAVRAALGLPEGAFLVGTSGRLHRSKAHRNLAEAVLRTGLPDMHALLLGFGPEQRALEALAASQAARGRVHVPGPLPPEKVLALVAALDLFAFPSLRESLPLAVLEAMQLGRPVVASEVGDLRAVLDDGRAGVLVPPGDVDALAIALHALHADAERRERLARAGEQRALSVFAPERLAREMEAAWLSWAR